MLVLAVSLELILTVVFDWTIFAGVGSILSVSPLMVIAITNGREPCFRLALRVSTRVRLLSSMSSDVNLKISTLMKVFVTDCTDVRREKYSAFLVLLPISFANPFRVIAEFRIVRGLTFRGTETFCH